MPDVLGSYQIGTSGCSSARKAFARGALAAVLTAGCVALAPHPVVPGRAPSLPRGPRVASRLPALADPRQSGDLTEGGGGGLPSSVQVSALPGGNVWRTGMNASQAFQATARVLAQGYTLASVDRRSLTLTTEWEKFFVDGRLFRNRVSVSVFGVGPRRTEVVVRNVVEYAARNEASSDADAAGWLPSPDITDEVPKLMRTFRRQAALDLTHR